MREQKQNMYPEDTWPARPADARGTHPCRAAGGNKVSYDMCTGINTSPGRNNICQGCTCPWRICYGCSEEHTPGPVIRDIDPATGLCDLHKESYRNRVPKAPPPPRGFERKPRVHIQLIETVPEPEPFVDTEEIHRVAARLHTLPMALAELVPLFAEGLGRTGVAQRLDLEPNTIGSRVHRAKTLLCMRLRAERGQMTEEIIRTLVAAYRVNHPVEE